MLRQEAINEEQLPLARQDLQQWSFETIDFRNTGSSAIEYIIAHK